MSSALCVYVYCVLQCISSCISDYFWEQTYAMSTVDMDTDGTVDERLPEHQLPKVIEDLIDKGKYDNMQRKVIKVL